MPPELAVQGEGLIPRQPPVARSEAVIRTSLMPAADTQLGPWKA